MKTIGILALQGDYIEHAKAIEQLGLKAAKVKLPTDLSDIDKLIIPGGESTTISLLARKYELVEPLKKFIDSGKPVWGTCAGLILLADQLAKLPIKVKRNFLGSQKNSFETEIKSPAISNEPFKVMFIRPPQILSVSPDVKVLAKSNFNGSESPVAVRYKNILATTFHSELDVHNSVSKYFVYKI